MIAVYTLTLTGVAQSLTSLMAAADQSVGGANDYGLRQILFQADPANGSAVYVGADNTVSSSAHGFSLDPTQASQMPVTIGPFETGPVRLSDFWALGSNGEKLHVTAVPY